jgi:NADH:ubiquinone oxidoreductase subunit C
MPMTSQDLEALCARIEAALSTEPIEEVQEGGSLLISTSALLDTCRYLRDEEGFDYLSNLSGVDWLEEGKLEVVYHLYAMRRGEKTAHGENPEGPLGPVVLKVQVDREQPVVPSVSSIWLSALWQERETYDLLGIRFDGHPNLKRIYLWDEYEDYPLRKDFVPEEA